MTVIEGKEDPKQSEPQFCLQCNVRVDQMSPRKSAYHEGHPQIPMSEKDAYFASRRENSLQKARSTSPRSAEIEALNRSEEKLIAGMNLEQLTDHIQALQGLIEEFRSRLQTSTIRKRMLEVDAYGEVAAEFRKPKAAVERKVKVAAKSKIDKAIASLADNLGITIAEAERMIKEK